MAAISVQYLCFFPTFALLVSPLLANAVSYAQGGLRSQVETPDRLLAVLLLAPDKKGDSTSWHVDGARILPYDDYSRPESMNMALSDDLPATILPDGHQDIDVRTYGKRGYYHPSRMEMFKRSTLNELIRRLMAMRGHHYSDGRATMMRFGAGRRK
ncbi:uncharacterized protein LOC118477667 [Aplysia californica]|uniref:Uncharacterized protein LOC106011308 n=1 Tax=Aplysia californica TaxID=6500 RepID=A0ABM0ZWF1_APLCA|nr:uncharacterized protein LOC106011308 [Aplysia californica]XP_035825591.1 uncharacterized protein LOC118477667 [Aplysia californica]